MTAWSDQQESALLEYSKPFAHAALIDYRALKAKVLRLVQREQLDKRRAMDKLRRKYEKLRAEYLRITGTTYSAWREFGPTAEWDECVEAARHEAVWDRLVDRGLAELR
jgi:hypothetical protein